MSFKYVKIDKRMYEMQGVAPLEDSSLVYGVTHYKGLKDEIKKLTTFLSANKVRYRTLKAKEEDSNTVEIKTTYNPLITDTVKQFPTIRITGLRENFFAGRVEVWFSESGYSVITKIRAAGLFEGHDDEGNGRWAHKKDMMKAFTVTFVEFHSGEIERVKYMFPFSEDWNDKNDFVMQKGDDYYKLGRETMLFGSFIQSAEEGASEEPIEWEILKQEGGKALVISKYGLIAKGYNTERKILNWEECTLRKWLNEDFYEKAFSEDEKSQIVTVSNNNTVVTKKGPIGGNDTEDKVFLLSADDILEFYCDKKALRKQATPYAVKAGAGVKDGYCSWWLRTIASFGPNALKMSYSTNLSNLDASCFYVNHDKISVCPVLCIDISK